MMNRFFKKDFRSILFVLSITFFLIVLVYFMTNDLKNKERLGYILTLIGSFLTTLSLGISIVLNKSKS
jgi:uncharacterized membrane protein YoaT (DUF817 family)